MKELTIEEKAKAYDEALERARIWKDKSGMPKDKQGILDDIFPELQVSGDERIRREMIKGISKTRPNTPFLDTNITREEALAWLEKQGENSVCKVKIGETYKCIASPRYTCFRIGDIYHVKDNFVAELINTCSGCFVLLEKQSKQKLVDKVEPIVVRDFDSVFSREQVEEIDKRIEESQRLYNAKLMDAMRKVEDFPMTD